MIKKKNILIVGSTKGIGKAIADVYTSRNDNLTLLSKSYNKLDISGNKSDNNVYRQHCDSSNKNILIEEIRKSAERMGNIDIAIYNAGVGFPEPFINFNSDNIKYVFDVNLFGLSYFLEGIIPIMKKQNFGIIAGVTSLADGRGYPGSASYCSSKSAASKLLESARVELQYLNIKVVTIKPGFVKTDMTAKNKFYMPFLMEPEKAGKIIVKGLDKSKKVIQFPLGTVLMVKTVNLLPNFIYDKVIATARTKSEAKN